MLDGRCDRIALAVEECIERCEWSPSRAVGVAEFMVWLRHRGWSMADVIEVGQTALQALQQRSRVPHESAPVSVLGSPPAEPIPAAISHDGAA